MVHIHETMYGTLLEGIDYSKEAFDNPNFSLTVNIYILCCWILILDLRQKAALRWLENQNKSKYVEQIFILSNAALAKPEISALGE